MFRKPPPLRTDLPQLALPQVKQRQLRLDVYLRFMRAEPVMPAPQLRVIENVSLDAI